MTRVPPSLLCFPEHKLLHLTASTCASQAAGSAEKSTDTVLSQEPNHLPELTFNPVHHSINYWVYSKTSWWLLKSSPQCSDNPQSRVRVRSGLRLNRELPGQWRIGMDTLLRAAQQGTSSVNGLYSLCISITFSIECTALAFALCWRTFSGRGSSWRGRGRMKKCYLKLQMRH